MSNKFYVELIGCGDVRVVTVTAKDKLDAANKAMKKAKPYESVRRVERVGALMKF